MNRRSFIRSLAGLAALAAAPAIISRATVGAPFDLAEFAETSHRGFVVVRDKTFRLTGPIVIDLGKHEASNVRIDRCTFVYVGTLPFSEPLVTLNVSTGCSVQITNCHFDPRGMYAPWMLHWNGTGAVGFLEA